MALPVACACGAAFEVEDTFAGQAVACPDCGAATKAPPLRALSPRTSGYAVASAVTALVGAFTLVGGVAAVLLGIVALVRIARRRGRVAGAGYAVFGILMGATFAALTGFALVSGEVFDRVRDAASASDVDRTGPLEVVRPRDGYAITRPSRAWGVGTAELVQQMEAGDNLVLAHPGKDAYLEVVADNAGGDSLDRYRDRFLDNYRKDGAAQGPPRNFDDLKKFTNFKLRESKTLADKDGAERAETTFDVRLAGQSLTYRARFIKPRRGGRVYVLLAWTHRRRLPTVEDEVRRAMESFRILAE